MKTKGAIEDVLPLFFIIVVLIVVALLFSLVNVNRDEALANRAEEQLIQQDGSIELLTFLEQPITIADEIITVREAIIQYYQSVNQIGGVASPILTGIPDQASPENKQIEQQLQRVAEQFLATSYLETGRSAWLLQIEDHIGNRLTLESPSLQQGRYFEKEAALLAIPTPHPERTITLKLFWIKTGLT